LTDAGASSLSLFAFAIVNLTFDSRTFHPKRETPGLRKPGVFSVHRTSIN